MREVLPLQQMHVAMSCKSFIDGSFLIRATVFAMCGMSPASPCVSPCRSSHFKVGPQGNFPLYLAALGPPKKQAKKSKVSSI